MIEVRIALGGAEVAKWLSGADRRTWTAEGIYITHIDNPVFVEFNDAHRLPTMGLASEVEFLTVVDDVSVRAAAATTLERLNAELDGLTERADKLRIEAEVTH